MATSLLWVRVSVRGVSSCGWEVAGWVTSASLSAWCERRAPARGPGGHDRRGATGPGHLADPASVRRRSADAARTGPPDAAGRYRLGRSPVRVPRTGAWGRRTVPIARRHRPFGAAAGGPAVPAAARGRPFGAAAGGPARPAAARGRPFGAAAGGPARPAAARGRPFGAAA